jgi:hypothetical protein
VKITNNIDKENSPGNLDIDVRVRINKKSGGICMMTEGNAGSINLTPQYLM